MGTKKGAWGKFSLTVLVCFLCSVIFGGISSSFAASISGHVYNSGGSTPIPNIHIIILDYSNGFQQVASTDTDAQGAYSVTLPSGRYDVWACATCSRFPYTNKYYPDTRSWNVATGVTLSEGETRPDIDFILLDAVPITGTVTDTDGNAVGGATVTLYTGLCKQQMVSRGFTDADGSYFQTALPGETVYISAEPNAYLTEGWWSPTGGTSSCNSAGTVSITGPSLSDINFSLSRGGSISGYVHKSDGLTPIQNVLVSATTSSPPYVSRSATTGQDGSYTISGLSAGNYTVSTCAKCNSLPFVDRSNTSVSVITGQPATVDFSLPDGVLISGHLTDSSDQPISFLVVYASSSKCDESPQNQVAYGYTDSNGNYTLAVPPGGLIYVHTSIHFGTPSYIPKWWDNAGGTTDCNAAVGIPRVLGEPQSGIDFSLQEESAGSGTIQGRVYEMDGTTAIPGLQLQLYRYDGVNTYYGAGSATTDSSGSYSITGLPASDSYVLKACATCSRLLYLDNSYNNKTDLSTATRISVGENQTVENIDFRLEGGVSITGRVTNTGGQGISGAWISLSSEQCTGWLGGVNADNDGNYFATVRPGTTVYLQAQSTRPGDTYIPQWYAGAGGTTDCHSAQSVVANQNVPGINISLPLGSSITGFVFENDGTTPIPNLIVEARDFTTDNWMGAISTRPDGSYTISGLPAGSYRVKACASCSQLSFQNLYYDNVSNYFFATPVETVLGQTRSGINFIMGESGPVGGAISGHVYRSGGETPIQNVQVTAKNTQTLTEWSATTGQDGSYTLSGLPAGGYEVKTCASCYGLPFLDPPGPSLAVVTAGQTTTIDFSLQEAVTISGRVTSPTGRPIPFPSVTIWAYSERCQGGSYWGGVSTDGNGDYTLTVPAVGEVYLWAFPYSYSNYLDEWWTNTGGTRDCNSAVTVPAVFGENQTAIDFVLEYKNPVAVSGRVVQGDGTTPIGNLQVYATDYDNYQWMGSVNTDSQGYYDLINLPPGRYRIHACSSCSHQLYVDEFYPDTRDHSAAEAVVVADGTTTVLNDIVLVAGVSITGKVTDPEGRPIPSISVEPWTGMCWQGQIAGFGTDQNGGFFFTVLPGEQVYLRANDWSQNLFVGEWWNGAEGTNDCNGATLVSAGATGVNFVLERDTLISGVVKDSAGNPINGTLTPIQVQAVQGDSCGFWQVIRSAPIDANGRFEIRGLEPYGGCIFDNCWGYLLRTENLLQSNYVNQWWTDSGGSFDCSLAQGKYLYRTVEGIEFRLDSGESISGSITNAHGGSITDAEIQVGVIRGDPCGQNQWVAWASTSSGSFSITGVPEGDYYLRFNNMNRSNYVNEWWNGSGNSLNCQDAETVTITSGGSIENRNAQLELGGAISGHVYQAIGTTPIVNLNVFATEFDTNEWRGGINTAPDGSYTIVGLPAGTYRVRACSSCNGGPYVDEFYDNTLFYHEAQPITVISDHTKSEIDFSLVEGVNVYGWVKDALGQPIPGIHVQAFAERCGQYPIAQSDTFNTGWFSFNNYSMLVPPLEEIYIRACAECNGMNFISRWYDGDGGTVDCDAALAVPANTGQTQWVTDILLDSAASISGTVRNSYGDLITGSAIGVSLFTGNPCGQNQFIRGTQTDPATGAYTVSGLSAGNYYLQTWNNGTFYMNEWRSGTGSTSDCMQAEEILVSAQQAIGEKDFYLDLGGAITGKVTQTGTTTGIGNLHVFAQDFQSGQWMGGVDTAPDGSYTIGGLPAGSYRVSACASCNGQLFVNAFFENTTDFNIAQPVTVVAGQATGNIHFSLSPLVPISGRVTDPQEHSISGMRVEVFSGKCWQDLLGFADTDSDGYFTIYIPPAEEVYIRTCPECTGLSFVGGWWTGAGITADCNGAAAFQVGSGQPVGFVTEPAGGVSGQVVAAGGQPIEGLHVQAFSGLCHQNFLGGGNTDASGNYSIPGLPAGNVYVRACADCNHNNFINEFWNGVTGTGATDFYCNLATPVGVTEGVVTPNINFSLESGPERLQWFDLTVTNGNLSASFDLRPGLNPFLSKAVLSGPSGFYYQYDLTNDVFQWLSECSYMVAWARSLTGPVAYGDYTLSLYFTDGAVVTSIRTLLEAHPIAVDHNTIDWTVNADGSMVISWSAPAGAPPEQVYQVGIFRDGQRYFTMGNLAQTSLHIPANSLRCLENGPESSYEIQVRAYDSGVNARENGTNVPFVYDPSDLDNRVTYFEASSFNGNLSLTLKVQPGSRESIASATVTGPDDFIYNFDLTNDWFDMSTESRTNNGWYNQTSIQTFSYGTYTLTVDFSDLHQEVRTYTLAQVAVTPADSLSFLIFPDGAIRFSWANPHGATGQKYHVRIRSQDGLREYFRSDFTYGNEWTVSASDLRALEHGRTYRWFVRASDENLSTVVQSETLYFVYDPVGIAANSLEGPNITGIAPNLGPTAGGTEVTITGANFVNGATVAVGGAEVATFFVDASTLRFTMPEHAAGAVNVAVTNPDYQSATLTGGFTYVPPPSIIGVSPSQGTTDGGTSVTITGANLVAGATVEFGGQLATVGTISSSQIFCTTPAHEAGPVSVVVTNSDSQSATRAGGFIYVAPAPPTAAIVRGAPAEGMTTNRRDYSIVVGGADVVRYTYRLSQDSGAHWGDWTPMLTTQVDGTSVATPITLDGLGDANQESVTIMLQVIGTNNSNNWQTETNATQRSWKIDIKSPAGLTLSGAPQDGATAAMSAISVKVGGTDVTHYKYRWNGGLWSNAISVLTSISNMPAGDGVKTLEVVGTDAYGNWQTTATARAWTVDNTVPTAVLTVDPRTPITAGALVNLPNAEFAVSGTDVTHYKYMLETDGVQGNWSEVTPVSGTIVLTGLADNSVTGQYILYVNAKNSLDVWQDAGTGGTTTNATIFNWRVDATPPSSASDIAANLGTPATTSVSLTWNAVETGLKSYRLRYATFEITADNWDTATGIYTEITPGAEGTVERYKVTGLLSNTTYYFGLRSEDKAGNLSDPAVVFKRTSDNRPVINSFSLTDGGGTTGHNGVARELSVVGDNFVVTESGTANTVRFISTRGVGGFSAISKGVSATTEPYTLTVDVPVGAPIGAYRLQIVNANGASALTPTNQIYTVTQAPTPVPNVTLVYPVSGSDNATTDITITGGNFGANTGQLSGVAIRRGAADPVALENVTWVNNGRITARVPSGIPQGVYEVQVMVTVAGDAKTNQVSATKFEVYTPVALTDTAVSTDQGVTMPADGIVSAPVSLSTAPQEETSIVGENVAEVAAEIEPGTEITMGGAPYGGTINPPRQVPVSSLSQEQQEKLGNNAVVFTMGIDDGTLQLGPGQTMFVQVEVTIPSGGRKPSVYYLNTHTGHVEGAGLNASQIFLADSPYRPKIDWFMDTYEKQYQWGGTIISERPSCPQEGYTTYTIGLLLNHMSSYAAGPAEPVITSVDPASGLASGGDTVTITGSNFAPGSTVTFGGNGATVVSINPDGTRITCTTPAHGQGLVDITVTSPEGLAGSMANAFTYNAASQAPYFGGGTIGNNQTITGNATIPTGTSISDNTVASGVTVTNNGTMINPTNNGVIVGGRVGGTVINTNGRLQGVALTSDAALNGGWITGTVSAEGAGATITNAVIDATSLTNVTIGSGCKVTQLTVDNNPGLDLTAAVTGANGLIGMGTPILVDADGNTLKTLADLVQAEINSELGDSTCHANEDEAGNTIISSGNMGNVVLPSVITSIVTTADEDSISFTESGELRIVEGGFALTMAPASADERSFTAALQGIGAEVVRDSDQVVTVSLSDGTRLVFRFNDFALRPGAVASIAAAEATFSLTGDPADPRSYCLMITYPDGTTQHMPPFIHALCDFRGLAREAGVSYRIVPSGGVIELLGAGGAVTYRGKPDYFIAGPAGTAALAFESAGDVNGDGLVDLNMITPSGKQVIYTLPLTQ